MKDVILCVGEALIDLIQKDEAFYPKVGGAPCNVAAALGKLEQKARFFTKLGDDTFARSILKTLNECHVDTSFIKCDQNYDTSLAFVSLDEDGQRHFDFYRKSAADLSVSEKDFDEAILKDVGLVHFGSVALKSESSRAFHHLLLKKAKAEGLLVTFDPNLRFNLFSSKRELIAIVREFLGYADILKISDEELVYLAPYERIEDNLKYLFNCGIKKIVYTMGKEGARLYYPDLGYVYSDGLDLKAIDTTGAGDAFMAAFLSRLDDDSRTADYLALKFANRYAASSCLKNGAIDSYLTLAEFKKWTF